MSAIGDAIDDLAAAAATVASVRVHKLGEDVTPPAVVVGPPRLSPLGGCPGPVSASFPVDVIVAADSGALERLWELVPAVWSAIEERTVAVVTAADPGTYLSGTTELPCYELTVECEI